MHPGSCFEMSYDKIPDFVVLFMFSGFYLFQMMLYANIERNLFLFSTQKDSVISVLTE